MGLRQHEKPTIRAWRVASRLLASKTSEASLLFHEYLRQGGPDAIQSLRATVRKLQAQLEESKGDTRLDRFRRLQRDLQEADQVNAALRQLLSAGYGCTDDSIDNVLQLKLFKTSMLYGASRELLLHENRLLRAQLEQRLVTSRSLQDTRTTATASCGLTNASPGGGSRPLSKSKADSTLALQGPHKQIIDSLQHASLELLIAEEAHRTPEMRHAEVQHDDGSRHRIFQLEAQLAGLLGQKLTLTQALECEEHKAYQLSQKLQQAQDSVAESRRQQADMLQQSEHLTKDIREFLQAESARADKAELVASEAAASAAKLTGEVQKAQDHFAQATLALQSQEVKLQEKVGQVDMLRGLFEGLQSLLPQVGQGVAQQQADIGHQIIDIVHSHAEEHHTAVQESALKSHGAYQAAQHSAAQSAALVVQQRQLLTQVLAGRDEMDHALRLLSSQLGMSRQELSVSERERRQLQRQAIAALALSRLQDKRYDHTVQLLAAQVHPVVADCLATGLGALQAVAGDTTLAKEHIDHIIDKDCCNGGAVTASNQWDTWAPADDTTSGLLDDSRMLRAQLQALAMDG